ncbi:LuxR family two component transcriptional regulator [Roseimicrobium gellanilyticum]|uniref:LuxR family two component transcriptional regulator n=1 Tax=Roseimicrobium gellanilyticum TaxID=748857 RepID=A0A366HV64_9BACT|nr:response regulator transcription factor [Roseimicrobium gellanilyticum]RBP48162.1 LuxR family two component transcriptional regulator [Roseimicrobium gellanilyticum]
MTFETISPPVTNPVSVRKVLIVDDHPAFRYGMVRLLKQLGGFEVSGEAGDGMTALEIFRRTKPDIVLMDISLPGCDGVELTKMMLSEEPGLTVLVVSMYDESNYALRALRAGAKGYLRKDESITELGTALQRISSHGLYVSQRFSDRLVFKAIHSGEDLGDSYLRMLSDRELEVFRAIGQGLGTREIAERLCLSIKTIETHRAHIKRKLRAEDSNEVVKLARDLQNLKESA